MNNDCIFIKNPMFFYKMFMNYKNVHKFKEMFKNLNVRNFHRTIMNPIKFS